MVDIHNETKSAQEAELKHRQQSGSSSHEIKSNHEKEKRREGRKREELETSLDSEIRSQEF